MTNVGIESILEKNQLTEKDVINCIDEVSRFDNRLLASYRNASHNWKEMNLFSVKRAIELFNKSTVNIRTGKILDFYRDKIYELKDDEIITSYLTINYTKSITIEPKTNMIVIAKRRFGESYVCSRENFAEEPYVSKFALDFARLGYPDSFDFLEKAKIRLSEIDRDIYNITFIVYVEDKKGPKQIFSSAKLGIGCDYNLDFFEFELSKEANSSRGAIGFELKKQEKGWSLCTIKDAISINLKNFIKYC